jgi:hypothetical protein
MATPTLPVAAPREEAAAPQPSPNVSPEGAGRIEPSLAMPDPQPTPEMSRQRAELRERLSRSASPVLPRAPAAAAPAVTPDKPAEASPERRPLSVRSFATAIQNRGAPLEPQAPAVPAKPPVADAPITASAPPVAPVPSAATREEPAGASMPEPSLEDFLSAELDSELSRDEAPLVVAEKAISERQDEAGPALAPPLVEPAHPPATAAPGASAEIGPDTNRDRRHSPATGEAAAPARKLTLEEEMERLLGDFSFGESDRRDRG